MGLAPHLHVVQIDRRRVDSAVELRPAGERAWRVRSGDPAARGSVVAGGVVAEAIPVHTGGRTRASGGHGDEHTAEQEQREREEASHWAARSGVLTQGPGGVSSDSAWR